MHDKNGYQTDKNTTEYLDDLEISWTLPLLKNRGGVIDQKLTIFQCLIIKTKNWY